MKKTILCLAVLTALFSCKEETAEPTDSNNAPSIVLFDGYNETRVSDYNVGARAYLKAVAIDGDGSIGKVIFYADNVPYDTVTASNTTQTDYWSSEYMSKNAGTVKFTAKAFDDKHKTTLSNIINITYDAVVIKEELAVEDKEEVVVEAVIASEVKQVK